MKKLFMACGLSLCACGGLLAAGYTHFKNVDSYTRETFVPPVWRTGAAHAMYALPEGKDKVLLYSISTSKEDEATDVYIVEAKNDPIAPDVIAVHYLLIDPQGNGRMRQASCSYPDGACETVAAAVGFNDGFLIETATTFTEEEQVLTRTFSTPYSRAETTQTVSKADGYEAFIATAMHESGRLMVKAAKDDAAVTDLSVKPSGGYLPIPPGGVRSSSKPLLNGMDLRPGGRF